MINKKMRIAILLLGVGLSGVLSTSYAAAPNQSDLLSAATKLGAEYDANYARQDPIAMASLYAKDGVLVSPAGHIIHGREELIAYYKDRFKNGAVSHHIEVKEVHLQGDGGYGIAHIAIESKDSGGALRTETGNLVAVYVKNANGWRLRLVEPSIPPKDAG